MRTAGADFCLASARFLLTCDSEHMSLSPGWPCAATSNQQDERAGLAGQPTVTSRMLHVQCREALGCGGRWPNLQASKRQATISAQQQGHQTHLCRAHILFSSDSHMFSPPVAHTRNNQQASKLARKIASPHRQCVCAGQPVARSSPVRAGAAARAGQGRASVRHWPSAHLLWGLTTVSARESEAVRGAGAALVVTVGIGTSNTATTVSRWGSTVCRYFSLEDQLHIWPYFVCALGANLRRPPPCPCRMCHVP